MSDALAGYYARRAGEYDAIYQKPERQDDIRRLGDMVATLLAGQRVLEIACGTGFWTRRIAERAGPITAIDISEEMLAIARDRLAGHPRVHFLLSDAFRLDVVEADYSAAFAGFWWSHLKRSQIGGFLDVLHSHLEPGAKVVFADNLYVEGSSTPISRVDDEGNSYQVRKLADASRFEVLKNFPTESQFVGAVGERGVNITFGRLTYFWCGSYETPS